MEILLDKRKNMIRRKKKKTFSAHRRHPLKLPKAPADNVQVRALKERRRQAIVIYSRMQQQEITGRENNTKMGEVVRISMYAVVASLRPSKWIASSILAEGKY